jgi:hypothetical protein
MIVNGVELPDIDIADADVLEHYENVLKKFNDDIAKIDTVNQKGSQVIRQECQLVFGVFNELFGAGTDKKVFGDKTNLNVCIESFTQLTEAVKSIDKCNAEKISSLVNKRNPRQNKKKNKHYNHYKPKLVPPAPNQK